MKRYSIVFVVTLLFSTFFSGFAAANGNDVNQKPNLLALGDSITYGSGLQNPGSEAFPYLIGNGSLEVTNLGVHGWNSTQLLEAVKSNPNFTGALAEAEIVTLNIGSNDLLQAVGLQEALATRTFEVTPEVQQKVEAAVGQLGVNLRSIIEEIRAQSPTVPIVLYNLYNPLSPNVDDPFLMNIFLYGDQIVQQVNSQVIGLFQAAPGVVLANAYNAFAGQQASYILPNDIHPTVAGHQALASLVNASLADLLPEESDPGNEEPGDGDTGEEPGEDNSGGQDPEGDNPEEDKPVLVALGDSITYGYNLEADNLSPSNNAFPNLICDGLYDVINHGYPGWTSSQLLQALKEDPSFDEALKNANVVTLNIGSNDLLRVVRQPVLLAENSENENPLISPVLEEQIGLAIQNLAQNLQLIIADIREQTSAPIVLYTLYNPFGESEDPYEMFMHELGEEVIPVVNEMVIKPIGAQSQSLLADAFPVFTGKQAELILPDDIHPNLAGQQVLADLATAVLCETEVPEVPGEEQPPVEEEPPVDEETPTPPNGEEPVEDEEPVENEDPVAETPSEEDADQTPVESKPTKGNKLPLTATSIFNFLGIGTLLTAIGASLWMIQRRRKERVLDI
ncbi:Lysophospholipase L1 [Mesobacillus persicus]|uniref:Lysophospholipase L1 n=1 Tax=Mesobacillus persicus TaxID=930146 RepID=A0A1H8CGD7_9BACI|nr:GDSL-type esterase/lipase family protein [Mesobacillus persicus]SEM93959.1 Lysophospholipase L1 [Mesobacillus persicus]